VSFVWSTAAKDLRRHAHDPMGLIFWIGVPLVIGLLMTSMSGGDDGPQPQAHVLVADLDDSFLSGLLVGALSQDAAGGLIQAEAVELADGRARMDDGEASALLVIPAGFAQAVLDEEPTTLELVTNPSQRILPGIVEESLSIFVDGTFYLHRLIGEDLQAFSAGPDSGNTFPDQQIAEFSITVNQLVNRISEALSPLLIELETVALGEEKTEGPSVNVALLFLPSILVMSLLMMAQGMSGDLWKERELRTLRRVVVSPQSIVGFLAGKLLSGAVIMFTVCFVVLTIGYSHFSIPLVTLPFAVLWAVFSGATLTALMTVLQLWASSRRSANIVTIALMFPLLMVGGSFFPFEAMPEEMVAIGKLTPNGWALTQLKAILLQRVVPAELAAAFTQLLAVGVVLFVINARRLRAGFARG
jgi:ABC-type multidrug transport system permease subunit